MRLQSLAVAVLICLGFLTMTSTVKAQLAGDDSSAVATKSLKEFLRTLDGGYDKMARYHVAFRDINGDGVPEAIVYIVGPRSCGSGGCHTYILTPRGNSWTVVGNIGLSYPPIYVLSNISKGWDDVGVLVRDIRTMQFHEVELKFDGKAYPRNPSLAKRLEGAPVGEAVITSADGGTPLYDN